jgi:hypothetical protein
MPHRLQIALGHYTRIACSAGSSRHGIHMPGFPGIEKAYATTFAKQKQLHPDIWVASHAAQFNMHDKHKPGDPYDPSRFVDPKGYVAKVAMYEKLYRDQLAKEKAAAKKE